MLILKVYPRFLASPSFLKASWAQETQVFDYSEEAISSYYTISDSSRSSQGCRILAGAHKGGTFLFAIQNANARECTLL
jgi:hypothetical protein